jgi:Protein of unknown function (DUF3375)
VGHFLGDYLAFQIEQSPAIMLLRSDHAGFIIGFFQSVFGETQRFQIGYNELATALGQYNEANGSPLTRRPSDYIETWADEKHRFLRKYYIDGNDEPQTELSYEVSSIMSWLHRQEAQDFVGTESRVSSLFQMIDKLASYSDTDPKTRIAKLQKEREALDQEIKQIKKTGVVFGWDDLRKREYLSHIIEDSRRLLADFVLIEDIFKDHARQLKEKMVAAQLSKGEILAQLLDMHDALEESDQGKSFRAFWNFLMSSSKQNELGRWLEKILRDLSEKPYLKGVQYREYVARLKGFKADLLQRGRKVLASQNRLTREIRTLLVQNSNQDSRVIQTAIADIKTWCIAEREYFASIAGETLLEIEYRPEVKLPLERPLWSEPVGAVINRELKEAGALYQRCQNERKKLDAIRSALGFTTPLTLESVTIELLNLKEVQGKIESNKIAAAQDVFAMRQEQSQIQQQMQELSAELLVTQKNKTLLPRQFLELRQLLGEKLDLPPRDLPYAAELMAVKNDEEKWRLAAEKLLRPLSLKLLVPANRFMDANQVLRSRNIGMKIVLQSIDLERVGKVITIAADDGLLVSKLEFLPRAKQAAWLQDHIRERFAFQCVNDMRAFRSAPRAVTVEGLIKSSANSSEKDDRIMAHAQYLMGWAHEDKIQRLTEESKRLRARLKVIQETLQKAEAAEKQQGHLLALLAQRRLFDSHDTVNTVSWEKKLKELNMQRETLMQQPETKEIGSLQQQLKTLAKSRDEILAQGAIIQNELDKIPMQMERLAALLAAHPVDASMDAELKRFIEKVSEKKKLYSLQLDFRLGVEKRAPGVYTLVHEDASDENNNAENSSAKSISTALAPELEGRLAETLRVNLANLAETKHHLGISLVRKLTAFKARFPECSVDMEASLDDLPAFLNKYKTLKQDALPAHEVRFKKLISKSIITDLTAMKWQSIRTPKAYQPRRKPLSF